MAKNFNKLQFRYPESKRIQDDTIYNEIKTNFLSQYTFFGVFDGNYYLYKSSNKKHFVNEIYKITDIPTRKVTLIASKLGYWYHMFVHNNLVYCYNVKSNKITTFHKFGDTKNCDLSILPENLKTFANNTINKQSIGNNLYKSTKNVSPLPNFDSKYILPTPNFEKNGLISINLDEILKFITNKQSFNIVINDLMCLTNVIKGKTKFLKHKNISVPGNFPKWVNPREQKRLSDIYYSQNLTSDLEIPISDTIVQINGVSSYVIETNTQTCVYAKYSGKVFDLNTQNSREMYKDLNSWNYEFWHKIIQKMNQVLDLKDLDLMTLNNLLILYQEYKRSIKSEQMKDNTFTNLTKWFYEKVNLMAYNIGKYYKSHLSSEVININESDDYFIVVQELLDYTVYQNYQPKELVFIPIKLHLPIDLTSNSELIRYALQLVLSEVSNSNVCKMMQVTDILYSIYKIPNPFYNEQLITQKVMLSQASILTRMLEVLTWEIKNNNTDVVYRIKVLYDYLIAIKSIGNVKLSLLSKKIIEQGMMENDIMIRLTENSHTLFKLFANFILNFLFYTNLAKEKCMKVDELNMLDELFNFAVDNVDNSEINEYITNKSDPSVKIYFQMFDKPDLIQGVFNYIPKRVIEMYNIPKDNIFNYVNSKFRLLNTDESKHEFIKFIMN